MFNLSKFKRKSIGYVVLTALMVVGCYAGKFYFSASHPWYFLLPLACYFSLPLLFLALYNLAEIFGALKRLDSKEVEYELKEEQVYYPKIKMVITKNYLLVADFTLHIFRIDELEYFYYELCGKNTKNVHYAVDIVDNKKKVFTHRLYLGYIYNPASFAEDLEVVQSYLVGGNANLVTEKTEEFQAIQKEMRIREFKFRMLLLFCFLIYLHIVTMFLM